MPFSLCLTFFVWTEITSSSIFDYRLDMLLNALIKEQKVTLTKRNQNVINWGVTLPYYSENRDIFQAHRYFLVFESSKFEKLVCLKAPLHPF